MTALVTVAPRYSSAACLSFCRIIAEISGGAYSLSSALTRTSLPAAETVYGTIFISSLTSSKRRPMKRLIEDTGFSGLVTAWRFATCPTSRSPVLVPAPAGFVGLFVIAALLGPLSGVLVAFAGDVPEISALDDYRPSTITRILARDGETIGEFATERRVVVGYDQISPNLRNAIIATEDSGFNEHFGVSMSRVAVTVLKDILTGKRQGASTITQQLARNVFLQQYQIGAGRFEISPQRKLKAMLVAI